MQTENTAAAAPVEFIDMTPTWAGLLPVLAELLERGNAEGRKTARAELARMAQAADKWNAHAATLRGEG